MALRHGELDRQSFCYLATQILRSTSDFPVKQQAIINAAFERRGVTLSDRKVPRLAGQLKLALEE